MTSLLTCPSTIRSLALIALLMGGSATVIAADKEPKVIQAEDAVAHATEKVTVEFKVMASNQIKDRNGKSMAFLNSLKDFKSEDNFTVVIFSDTLDKFREADIEDPAKHFKNKTIRVTGGIELRRGKAQIILKSPDQIKVVKEEAAKSKRAA